MELIDNKVRLLGDDLKKEIAEERRSKSLPPISLFMHLKH